MLVSISLWINAHAKVITLAGAFTGGVAGLGLAVHDYIDGVDDRIVAVEVEQSGVDAKLEAIQYDVSEIKCMTLMIHQGGDPVDCIYD